MWLKLTAKIDKDERRTVYVNMDNIVTITEAKSSPSMLMALDGQTYPVMESPEQISEILNHNGRCAIVPVVPDIKINTRKKK